MSHEMKDYFSLSFAWGSTILSAITSNVSVVISAAAAFAALVASVYSIQINRAKWRKIRAHEEALCKACGEVPGSVECPFPEDERPANCRRRLLAELETE